MDTLFDRPDLGCAMLIAACQERGIKTHLIKGQTRYLKDMFVNDSEELWHLIQDLKRDDLKKLRLLGYKKDIQKKGIKQFQDELKDLYQYVIVDKTPRHYFDAQVGIKLASHLTTFKNIYFYYLRELNYPRLKIVERYVSEIINNNPRYIGFSLRNIFGSFSRIIRKRIKEVTDIPIIVGGSLTPFIDFKHLDKIFKEEYFDYLVVGAGERALPDLIQSLQSNREPAGIANVFYRKGGRIEGNNLEVINDLDSLPYPDYSQFDLDLYFTPKRILPLQTARGCCWRRCAFCSHHHIDFGNYKAFSIEKVIETIEHLQDTYNCSHFTFNDPALPPGRAKKISKAIISNNNTKNIYISTYARLDDGYNNSDLFGLMRKAGFVSIMWGMESGCQRVLGLMDKGTRVPAMSQILRKSSKNNISNLCFALFGFPGETREEAQMTVDFLKNHEDYIDVIIPGTFLLVPCAFVIKNPEKWGVDIKEDGSFSTKSGMSRKELNVFFSKFSDRIKINGIRTASNKLKYYLPGFNHTLLFFLNFSYGLLSNTLLSKRLKKGRIKDIFPIILGEIKKEGRRNVFQPIKINKPRLFNKYLPQKTKDLDTLEEKIFTLSDGLLSIEDIASLVYNNSRRHYKKEYIRKKCARFFHYIFDKNHGLGFTKSWRSVRDVDMKRNVEK